MKVLLKLAGAGFLILTLLACGLHIANSGTAPLPPQQAGTVRIATHNVHYILAEKTEGRWSVSDWHRRKHALDQAFKALSADIVAFQEMETFEGSDDDTVNLARAYLLEHNPGYAAAAVGDWRAFPSTQPIFYRTDRFTVADQGWFFFSETPDTIYSRTFDGSYPAFTSWVRFAPLDGSRPFTVVNVHLDYSSRNNRDRSAALITERLAPLIAQDEPVILAGDLNERAGSTLVGDLRQAGLTFAQIPGSTYHFDRGINLFGAIDHIAMTRNVTVVSGPHVLRQRFDGVWPSDHYPVSADLSLPR